MGYARSSGTRATPNQQAANQFDADLYRLISRAESLSMGAETADVQILWHEVATRLGQARATARSMMSEADRSDGQPKRGR